MSHDKISSGINCQEEGINRILEAAAAESRRISLAIQKIAGTTYCKGVQIHGLKQWAIANHLWIDDINTLGEFSDRGSENEVYMDSVSQIVNKLNDFRYADDNLGPFFQRINIHNYLFPDCAYTLKGFAENQDGKTCAILAISPILIVAKTLKTEDSRLKTEKNMRARAYFFHYHLAMSEFFINFAQSLG